MAAALDVAGAGEDPRAPAIDPAQPAGVVTPGASDQVEVRRSRRRRRTVSAYREDGRTVVLIPARFTRAEEAEWVARMLGRLERQDRRRRPSDQTLATRAAGLSTRYLGGLARPSSVAWVANQASRWGSCTPSDGTIRISSRVRGMPAWVLDYVLLHELAHLIEPRHGPAFWALLESYPRTERARGYLEGVAASSGLDLADEVPREPADREQDDDVIDGVTEDDEDGAVTEDVTADDSQDRA